MLMKITTMLMAGFILAAGFSHADIVTETVDYDDRGTTCEGVLVYDNSVEGPRPAVLIFHQWAGIGEYELARAKMLAGEGYAVFVGDVYSKGIRPESIEDRQAQTKIYNSDRAMTRERAWAALAAMLEQSPVDKERTASIGYCFGGMVALELARDGAPMKAFVSIHGTLNNPNPDDTRNIKGAVLIQHGADDPFVPADDLITIRTELESARMDFRITEYAGAVHAFTDWNAGDNPSSGVAYNQHADEASWQELLSFLGEQLK